MPVQQLKEFLDENHVKYVSIKHSLAYTAQEIAASAHVSGNEMIKTVVVKVDGALALVAMPAPERLDLTRVRARSGAQDATLASESEFVEAFPGCELGAMPPFGNLYGMETYAAPSLARRSDIAFNAGTHTEVIRMAYADFERLVKPRILATAGLTPG